MYKDIIKDIDRAMEKMGKEMIKIEDMLQDYTKTTIELQEMKKDIEKNEKVQKELDLQDVNTLNVHRITK